MLPPSDLHKVWNISTSPYRMIGIGNDGVQITAADKSGMNVSSMGNLSKIKK